MDTEGQMEMDLCWGTVGDAEPLHYFHRYPDRFPCLAQGLEGLGGTLKDESAKLACRAGQRRLETHLCTLERSSHPALFRQNDLPNDIRASFDFFRDLHF